MTKEEIIIKLNKVFKVPDEAYGFSYSDNSYILSRYSDEFGITYNQILKIKEILGKEFDFKLANKKGEIYSEWTQDPDALLLMIKDPDWEEELAETLSLSGGRRWSI